jgi:hypothetical protein
LVRSAADALRRFCLILFVLGAAATAAELLLVDHYEDAWQFAPFVLLAFATLNIVWLIVAPGRAAIRALRLVMLLLIAGGLAGLWLHYRGNAEFERELSPDSAGLAFFWSAIKGASPPTLAPAALIHLGLLGLASVYRHPLFAKAE